jgi:CBS domain-containing protein/anti-sigma regulatory factor (Ser/Thr protein kinase)
MPRNKKFTKTRELTYELKIKDVMTKDVVTVAPETPVSELRDTLRERAISGTPVVDKGRLVGLMSIEDFIKCLADGEMDVLVGERMTRDVETLYADEPVVHAVRKLDQYGYGRLPVLERRSTKLVGIITKGDIIRGLLKKLEIDYHEEEIHRYRASHIFEDIIADNTTLTFEYSVAGNDFDKAGESASGLRRTLYRLGIQPDIVRRIAIAAYEAEMNIVVFTDGGKIVASVQPDQIQIDALDCGPGIPDINKALQPGFSTAPERIRELGFGAGMGLVNIDRCADKMTIESEVGKGTHVRAVIYLN